MTPPGARAGASVATSRAAADTLARRPAAVVASGVTAGYGNRRALADVDLTIPVGTITAVAGPNGSGKSTLLKLMLGLLRPWSGSIEVLGREPRLARPDVGYVPQAGTADWQVPATAAEVVMMGLCRSIGLFRWPGRAHREAVYQALAEVGMLDRADDQIGELSGGQRQRVFLARALVARPKLLLLDEPIAGVDAVTEQEIYVLLRSLVDRGVTIVMTTHNLATVADNFDRVLFLNGRVIAYGSPAEVLTAETLRATYGPRVALFEIEGQFFTVDAGEHHG